MLRWLFTGRKADAPPTNPFQEAVKQFELGNAAARQGKHQEAEACYRRALAADDRLAEVHCNLGNIVREGGRLDEALAAYDRALALKPDFPEALYNLGNVLKDTGKVDEAIVAYRRAMQLAPQDAQIHSNLLHALNYAPTASPEEVHAEHLAFGRRFAAPTNPRPSSTSRAEPRRLRLGYVSGDLRKHPVAQFVEPVLARHDRSGFEVFCYYNYPWGDEITARLRAHADVWRDVWDTSDAALAELIRADRIDVLVDLSGHTGENRLAVFARKPAPVQATWLGYLNTTGLEAMGYRITDAYASPASFDALHRERLVRLPHSQWCYCAPRGTPEVAPAPCLKNGHLTYGAFSNLAKIGPGVIALWSTLLGRVPDSRLIVMGPGLASIRGEFLARFTANGADASRIELHEATPLLEYLDFHRAIDVMLDTFPYAGGTTTCHAAWMGVPTVSIVGNTVPSRGGASVLHALGLDELVAAEGEAYLAIAARLASDRPGLVSLRRELRERMAGSALSDARGFTRDLETAYRAMWQTWCRTGK